MANKANRDRCEVVSKEGEEMRLPTTLEIRDRIHEIGRSVHPTEDRRVAKDIDEYQIQMALKYQYIVAGRVSEIAGKYQPKSNLGYAIDIEGEESLLLPVKTAKRKTAEGWSLRGPSIPLDDKYEPWAEELYEYLQDNKWPYKFADKDSSSKRILEAAAASAFEGFNWLLKPSSDRASKWVPFTSHSLRRLRSVTLYALYNLNPFDLLYYGGWEDARMTKIPGGMAHYLYVEMDQSPFSLYLLAKFANNYLLKLCKPFKEIHSMDFSTLLTRSQTVHFSEDQEDG